MRRKMRQDLYDLIEEYMKVKIPLEDVIKEKEYDKELLWRDFTLFCIKKFI